MPVSSSSVAVDPFAQVDGRFWITETHVISDGTTQTFSYLGDPTNRTAVMNARVAGINEQLAQAEADAILNGN
jgi:hypothetical protein